ncbi:MAG: hypothetical protein ACPGVK_08120 [Halocynthiibacter sp.]
MAIKAFFFTAAAVAVTAAVSIPNTDVEAQTFVGYPGVPEVSRDREIVTVQADFSSCAGLNEDPHPCIEIERFNGKRRKLLAGISGYNHEEGTERRILVERIEYDAKSPMMPMDVPSVLYFLVPTS